MAYTEAQKDAVIDENDKSLFGFGIRQYPQGLKGDTLTVWFSSYYRRSKNFSMKVWLRDHLGDVATRLGLKLVVTDKERDAFLKFQSVPYREDRTLSQTVKGYSQGGWDPRVGLYNRYEQTIMMSNETLDMFNGNNKERKECKYFLRHEILHTIGMEHVFNTSDGDSDTNLGILDTDMAYIKSSTKEKPGDTDRFFSDAVRENRFAGPLDRRVMDTRIRPYLENNTFPSYNGPF